MNSATLLLSIVCVLVGGGLSALGQKEAGMVMMLAGSGALTKGYLAKDREAKREKESHANTAADLEKTQTSLKILKDKLKQP